MSDTPSIPTLFDYNQTDTAPITNRPAQALYSKQGGAVLLGSDYGSTPKAQALKIDANGNLSTIPSTATTGAVSPGSATTVLGNVQLAMLSGAPTATQMDGLGNIAAQPVQSATFSVVVSGVATANAKSMLAVLNKSTSSVLRLVACFAQNSARTPSTLTTYYVYAQELRFITGFSGGTAATPVSWDSADTLASNVTCSSGATVSGEAGAPLRRWVTSNYPLAPGATAAEDTTGDAQGREPWHQRYDPSAKCITIRPGAGLHLKCASTSDNGAQDVTFVFTQAQA